VRGVVVVAVVGGVAVVVVVAGELMRRGSAREEGSAGEVVEGDVGGCISEEDRKRELLVNGMEVSFFPSSTVRGGEAFTCASVTMGVIG
jgi:hypothetical protein